MPLMSIGDLAQSYQMRRNNLQLKEQMVRLAQEMTTGVTADLAGAVSGDFMALAGIDRSLRTLDAYRSATSEASLFATTMQAALSAVQDIPGQIGPTLLSAATSSNPAQVGATTADARQKFLGAVATLNVQVGDRFLFAGKTTDVRPLADGKDMLAALVTATASALTAADVALAVDTWFDAAPGGGGFLDVAYFGSASPLAPFRLGEDETAELAVTATDPALRDLLKGLAMASLVAEGVLSASNAERSLLVRTAGERVLGADGTMAVLRARVGTVEGHVDQIAVRNSAETTALRIARNAIVAADPYETASALEAVTAQMETLYTLTARLSRLRFSDYL